MGLDATVMCNCFKEGKTSEPPFPQDQLYVDGEGFLHVRTDDPTDLKHRRLYEWMQTACQHPGLNFARERISNWGGYRLFQEAMATVGWDRFPTLKAELPSSNGGLTQADAATKALKELASFRSVETIGKNSFLVDSTTGDELYNHIAAYEGVFMWGGSSGFEVGLGEFMLFVREKDASEAVFLSSRFTQKLVGPAKDGRQPVELRDLDTGESIRLPDAIRGRAVPWPDGRMQDDKGGWNFGIPKECHVEVRVVTPEEFEYILGPLERVFRAAVETGNPVRWS